jgi:hypothetical protein
VTNKHVWTDGARNKKIDTRWGTECIFYFDAFIEVISRGAEAAKVETHLKKIASEDITRLQYDHHLNSATRAYFHGDHTDLCVGVVQITIGESSEIFCSSLVGGRDPVNKWMRKGGMNKARWIVLRNVSEGITFQVHLR